MLKRKMILISMMDNLRSMNKDLKWQLKREDLILKGQYVLLKKLYPNLMWKVSEIFIHCLKLF